MTSPATPGVPDPLDPPPSALTELLPPPFVVPRYDGLSVANVPATVGSILGARVGTLPPLDERLWRDLAGEGVDRVVLLILDAVGWLRFRQGMAADPATADWLQAAGAAVAPITAIFPSTTTATLTTLWTGTPPARHGILGYQLWLREYGIIGDMIGLSPAIHGLGGSLKSAGLDTATFLPVPRVVEQLAEDGVRSYIFIDRAIRNSGLSELHFRGATAFSGFAGLGDCMTLVCEQLERRPGERALVAAYWDTVDTLTHLRGPAAAHWDAEWQVLMHAVRTQLVEQLSPAARRRTLLAITADHGHNPLAAEREIAVSDHPELWADLLMPPTGDRRAPYLYVRRGRREAVRATIESRLGDAFHVLDVEVALAAGLWGPGRPMPEAAHRIGDLALLARDGYSLMHRPSAPDRLLRGGHGSLWPDEALVPWIVVRLE